MVHVKGYFRATCFDIFFPRAAVKRLSLFIVICEIGKKINVQESFNCSFIVKWQFYFAFFRVVRGTWCNPHHKNYSSWCIFPSQLSWNFFMRYLSVYSVLQIPKSIVCLYSMIRAYPSLYALYKASSNVRFDIIEWLKKTISVLSFFILGAGLFFLKHHRWRVRLNTLQIFAYHHKIRDTSI